VTIGELLKSARLLLDDNRLPYLWSDDELILFINQSVNEAAIRSRCIVDSTTPDCSKITVVAGTAKYSVHDSVFQIDRVYDSTNKKVLCKAGIYDLDIMDDGWQAREGKPTHYIEELNRYGEESDGLRSISLYPIPDSDLTLNLTVFRTSIDSLTESDQPEIPIQLHYQLLHWVAHLAFLKRDADTYNVKESDRHEQQFTLAFGERQELRKLRWRNKHRNMQVRGRYF
jgi:hypothetical protein